MSFIERFHCICISYTPPLLGTWGYTWVSGSDNLGLRPRYIASWHSSISPCTQQRRGITNMYPVKTIKSMLALWIQTRNLRGKISLGAGNDSKIFNQRQVNNNRVPNNSLIPSKTRCVDNDNSDCYSELTDLEEWTNPYGPKTLPRKWAE